MKCTSSKHRNVAAIADTVLPEKQRDLIVQQFHCVTTEIFITRVISANIFAELDRENTAKADVHTFTAERLRKHNKTNRFILHAGSVFCLRTRAHFKHNDDATWLSEWLNSPYRDICGNVRYDSHTARYDVRLLCKPGEQRDTREKLWRAQSAFGDNSLCVSMRRFDYSGVIAICHFWRKWQSLVTWSLVIAGTSQFLRNTSETRSVCGCVLVLTCAPQQQQAFIANCYRYYSGT